MGLGFIATALFMPLAASAHEVYVLGKATIINDVFSASPNPFTLISSHQYQFFFWGFIVFVAVTTVFFVSMTHRLEEWCYPFLQRMKRWAPLVARVTLGACLIASGYHSALYGPEIPLDSLVGAHYSILIELGLYITGVLIVVGLCTRLAAFVAMVLFAIGIYAYGAYMLTYANYVGEMLVVFLLGGGKWSVDSMLAKRNTVGEVAAASQRRFKRLEPYAFLALRVLFGVSIAFAAFYAKYLHSNLALDLIEKYYLTNFFHFEPLFIVLGACIVEILIGIFFALGFEIRHTSLFFMFWITLSLLYFGESVWPHLILVGVNISLFMYGYDKFTVQGRFFSRGKYEPVL